MKSLIALAAALALAGCSEEPATTVAAPPEREAAPRGPQLPEFLARQSLPQKAGGLPLFAQVQPPRSSSAETPQASAPARAPEPPPLPFAYVGKLRTEGKLYAVVMRGDSLLAASVGDAIAGAYRLQSIGEDKLLVMNIDYGIVQALAFSGPSVRAAGIPSEAFPKPGTDDVSVQLAGPTRVGLGEEFTFTVSLDSGAHAMLDTSSVEIRFDPKVLQLRKGAIAAASGAARVDISGAYMGHPAPATMEFRVVAQAPTATEIRVVPTSIADAEGRNVGVNSPSAHRLAIVTGPPAAAGGARGND